MSTAAATTFTVYYHTACTAFWGRAGGSIAILKHAGAQYEVKGADAVPPDAGFAVPMVTLPSGLTVSQTPVIAHTLGKQLNLLGSGEVN